MKTNCPIPPFGGSNQYDISSDGYSVVFAGQDRNENEAWSTDWKIYLKPRDSDMIYLTSDIISRTDQPKFSPDGKKNCIFNDASS